jgi:cation diffusion facilitator CzcD-associated flavoprotein CzcO
MQSKYIENIIIGAGPGGLQLGYFFEKDKMDYCIIEKDVICGSFFAKHPVDRKLISINKKYTGRDEPEFNMRHDWNSLICDDPNFRFTNYTDEYYPYADDYVKYLNDFYEKYKLNIYFKTLVSKIHTNKSGNFIIECIQDNNKCEYVCAKLFMATGLNVPNIPNIEGIELASKYTDFFNMTKDKLTQYANKRIVIIGGGNSSFEIGNMLTPYCKNIIIICRSPPKFAINTHNTGNIRGVYFKFFDTYLLKSQNVIDVPIGSILKITKSIKYQNKLSCHKNNKLEFDDIDTIINCTGMNMDVSLYDCGNKLDILNNKIPLLNYKFESLNIKNLYFVGALTQALDYKMSSGAFIHGFRYNAEALFNIISNISNISNKTWPHEIIGSSVNAIATKILQRLNNNDALFQMFGSLYDVVTLIDGKIVYYYQLPLRYIFHNNFINYNWFLIIGFEYGEDPFDFTEYGPHKTLCPSRAVLSRFLHPVIRFFSVPINSTPQLFNENSVGQLSGPKLRKSIGFVSEFHLEESALFVFTDNITFFIPLMVYIEGIQIWMRVLNKS